ncbi:MAG: hypothetical protein WBA74_28080 [Cyclobacteriaceae bacterium]
MRNLLILGLVVSVFYLGSCNDDEDATDSDGEVDISLDNLSPGKGIVEVSGAEDYSFNSLVFGANLSATINDKEYRQNRITLRSDQPDDDRRVAMFFYIPESLGQTVPPNGTHPVTFDVAALDQTYVAIFVEGEVDSYNSNSLTTGTLTVSESSPENLTFNVVFDLQKLNSFDDREISLKGAFKF